MQFIRRFKQHSHFTLAKDIFSYGLVHGAMRIVPFVTLPILTHLLSQESIGQIEIILSVFSMLLATLLAFQQGYFRFYFVDSKAVDTENIRYTFYRFYLILSLSTVFLLFLITSIVGMQSLLNEVFLWPLLLASLSLFPTILYRFALGNLRLQREIKNFAYMSLFDAILKGMSVILIIWLFDLGIYGYFGAFLLSSIISMLVCYRIYFRGIRHGVFRADFLREAVLFSLPLIPAVLLTTLGQYIGRFFAASELDWRDVAILAISLKLALVAKLMSQAFNFAWQTLSVKYISHPEGDEFYAKTLDYFIVSALIIVVVVSLLAPFILTLFFPPEYLESSLYVPFLTAAILILNATSIVEMGAKIGKKTHWILLSNLSGLAANTGFLLCFIKDFGILAVAFGSLFHQIISFWIQYVGSQKTHRISYKRYSLVGLTILFPSIALALYYLMHGSV